MVNSKNQMLIIGHVSLDTVKNIWGEHKQLGGAALYASFGARVLLDDVRIISAIGRDFKHYDMINDAFPGSLIKRVNIPSTVFHISYDEKFRATYDTVKLGAGALLKVNDLPTHWIRKNTYIHLAPIRPAKAEKFLKRIKKISAETWVSLNSSITYLTKRENRKILKRLMLETDLTILNDQEAMLLAETDSLMYAINTLKAKRLAVTLGQIGAIIIEDKVQLIPALSGLTVTPKDTTGAGDTWSGSLLAAYIQTRDWTKSVVAASLISAVKCLGWNFEKIRNLKFNNLEEIAVHVLSLSQKTNQLTLRDFLS